MNALRILWQHTFQQNISWNMRFWAFNSLLLMTIACRYWPWMNVEYQLLSLAYVVCTVVGLFGLFAILLFLLTSPCFLLPSVVQKCCSVVVALLVSGLLLTDTMVYDQLRFHLNGFVFEYLWDGHNQIIVLSWMTWLTIIGFVFILIMIQCVLAYWASRQASMKICGGMLMMILACLSTSQFLHAWKDAHYDALITGYTPHFPLYYPLTAKKTLARWRWVNGEEAREESLKVVQPKKHHLKYPLFPIEAIKPEQQRNVLMLVVDAWRYDDANDKTVPNIMNFAKGASRFHQHISGGNSTQPGIFSLFYGLPATYWDSFRGLQQRPVMMEMLAQQGYEFSVYGSAPLDHPPFDRTVFSGISPLRLMTPGRNAVERDQRIIDDFNHFIEHRGNTRPFFGFLFLDSAHSVDFPDTMDKPFSPSWERVDHLKLHNDFNPEPYRNRYRNALYYVDQLMGKVLETLRQQGVLDNTIVVITSDHGQEFNDNGKNYWGHGSNFSQPQIHVPLFVRLPSGQGQDIYGRTSHFDISVTLMELALGVTSPAEHYSTGYNLYDRESSRDWLIVGSYMQYAVVGHDELDVVYPGGIIKTITPQLNNKPERGLKGSALHHVMLQQNRFLR
ncbi:Inner membrane protein YejM [invertebrate metagenome]|uniref:Inner membrane protein YejM n=1 Tax=invertebrate metagenome TaxID=1711999 RepID=A0A2H9T691_9ZZZZ